MKLYCERQKDESHHSLVDNNSIYEEKDDGIVPPSFFVARKEAMLVNDFAHQRMVQEAVKKKFGSHKVLLSKRPSHYPEQTEREFQRVTNAYMQLLNKRLKEYLPQISRAAKAEHLDDARSDGLLDFLAKVMHLLVKLASDLQKDMEEFGLYDRIERIAKNTKRTTSREWKKDVKATLGIDLLDDYYEGEFYEELLKKWIEDNVALIKTIPQDTLGEMREVILDGYRNGKLTKDIAKEIQHIYGVEKRHAQFIARDQTAKLNAQISRKQQEDAGVKEYVWSTSGDSRVRDSHRALNNKRFRWDDPPVVDIKTGRRCHPGQDYQCRCVALAVFDYKSIDLPISSNGGG